MTVFDVNEIETKFAGNHCSSMKCLDDDSDLRIREQRMRIAQAQAPVQNRVVVSDAGFAACVQIRLAIAARVSELQAD